MAVDEEQAKRLDGLYERGLKNQVPDLKMINGNEIKNIEPNCVVGTKDRSWSIHILPWKPNKKNFDI